MEEPGVDLAGGDSVPLEDNHFIEALGLGGGALGASAASFSKFNPLETKS